MKIVDLMEKVFHVQTFKNKRHQQIVPKRVEGVVLMLMYVNEPIYKNAGFNYLRWPMMAVSLDT